MSISETVHPRPQPAIQSTLPVVDASAKDKPSLLFWRNVRPQDVYHVLGHCKPAEDPARLQQLVSSLPWSGRRQLRDGVRGLKKLRHLQEIHADTLVEGLARRSPSQLQRDINTLATHSDWYKARYSGHFACCLAWLQRLDDADYSKCVEWVQRHAVYERYLVWDAILRFVPPQRLGAAIGAHERLGLSVDDRTHNDVRRLRGMSDAELETLVQRTDAAIPPGLGTAAVKLGVARFFLLWHPYNSGDVVARLSKLVPVREITDFFAAIATVLPLKGASAVLEAADDVAAGFLHSESSARERCLQSLRALRSEDPEPDLETQACLDAAMNFLKREFRLEDENDASGGVMAPVLVRALLALATRQERDMALGAVNATSWRTPHPYPHLDPEPIRHLEELTYWS